MGGDGLTSFWHTPDQVVYEFPAVFLESFVQRLSSETVLGFYVIRASNLFFLSVTVGFAFG